MQDPHRAPRCHGVGRDPATDDVPISLTVTSGMRAEVIPQASAAMTSSCCHRSCIRNSTRRIRLALHRRPLPARFFDDGDQRRDIPQGHNRIDDVERTFGHEEVLPEVADPGCASTDASLSIF